MDLRSAVHTHITWLIDLVDSVVDGKTIDPETIRRDDRCRIGEWIHGEGRKFDGRPEFEALREAHARFHTCAASAVALARDGNRREALERLDDGGSCGLLSHRLLEAFCDFYSVLRKGGEKPEQYSVANDSEPDLPTSGDSGKTHCA